MKNFRTGFALVISITIIFLSVSRCIGPVPAFHELQFDANGGEGSMTALQVAEGTPVTLPACTFTQKKSGYFFGGWSTSADGSVEYAAGDQITMGSDSIILFAVWI